MFVLLGLVGEKLQIYARWISACNSERIVKIGAELPKLSQKENWVSVFWTTLYIVLVTTGTLSIELIQTSGLNNLFAKTTLTNVNFVNQAYFFVKKKYKQHIRSEDDTDDFNKGKFSNVSAEAAGPEETPADQRHYTVWCPRIVVWCRSAGDRAVSVRSRCNDPCRGLPCCRRQAGSEAGRSQEQGRVEPSARWRCSCGRCCWVVPGSRQVVSMAHVMLAGRWCCNRNATWTICRHGCPSYLMLNYYYYFIEIKNAIGENWSIVSQTIIT